LEACLSEIPYYYMSMFLSNTTFIEKLDKHTRKIPWAGKKKEKLIVW
jgi:hypothetical protein